MSGGFSNPIVGGDGALVYPSIHSPNFNVANPPASPTPSWAILKNGLAYFFGLVLSGGTITGPNYVINNLGIFLYNGTPGAGNPPIDWMSVSNADPFGNALPSTTGIAGTGTFQAGNTVITPAGEYVYAGTPALGNLIWANVSANGTDQFGNIVYLGAFSYEDNGTATPAFGAGLQNGSLLLGTGNALSLTGGAEAGSVIAGNPGGLFILSGAKNTADQLAVAQLALRSAAVSVGGAQPSAELSSSLILDGLSSAPTGTAPNATLYSNAAGFPKALATTDANVYNVGSTDRSSMFSPTTINSVSFTPIVGTIALINGVRYRYYAKVIYHGNQSAGQPIISFNHPAMTLSAVNAHEEWSVSGSPIAQTNTDLAFVDVTGPTLSGGRFCYKSEGEFSVSAAGQNLTLSAACTVAADSWVTDMVLLIAEPIL